MFYHYKKWTILTCCPFSALNCMLGFFVTSNPHRVANRSQTFQITGLESEWNHKNFGYALIDRPGVLGNYVPVNYHSLYDLSVLVSISIKWFRREGVSIGCILRSGNVPPLKINAIWFESIKSYLNRNQNWNQPFWDVLESESDFSAIEYRWCQWYIFMITFIQEVRGPTFYWFTTTTSRATDGISKWLPQVKVMLSCNNSKHFGMLACGLFYFIFTYDILYVDNNVMSEQSPP